MRRQLLVIAFAVAFATASSLYAGCGSSSCPLDLNNLNVPATRHFSLDLSLQYIDQDQPRAGTENVDVGAIHAHHDEVRTINRITTAALTWAASDRLHVTATLPFVSRAHQHLASSHGHAGIAAQHNTVPDIVGHPRHRRSVARRPRGSAAARFDEALRTVADRRRLIADRFP